MLCLHRTIGQSHFKRKDHFNGSLEAMFTMVGICKTIHTKLQQKKTQIFLNNNLASWALNEDMLTAPPWTRKHFWLCSPSLQMLKFLGQQNTDLVCIYDKHFVPDVNFCVYFIDLKLRFSPTIWYHTVLIYWTCENFWCSFATVILCDDMRSVWPSRSLALLARLQTQRQVNPLGVCGLTTQYTPLTPI